MDTLASAGIVSSLKAVVTGADGGHSGWAASPYLRIAASVQDCVHMIAAHELRKNFPIDTVTIDGVLGPRCQELIYPGSHSDVGGGYAPGDLGIACGQDPHPADATKLAQIPLNHMLDCAIVAGAPMKNEWATDPTTGHAPFAVAPALQKAYDDFISYSTLKPRPVHEWLQPYLHWRWQVRTQYAGLKHVREASKDDHKLLREYNARLIADAAFLDNKPARPGRFSFIINALADQARSEAASRELRFEDEARTVLAIAMAAPPTDARLHTLFDLYVHDSLAGFDHNNLELSGYWHCRRGFLGHEKGLVVENDGAQDNDRAAA